MREARIGSPERFQSEEQRHDYLVFQMLMVTMAARFGHRLANDLYHNAWREIKYDGSATIQSYHPSTGPPVNPNLAAQVLNLSHQFTDYYSEVALFYARFLTSDDPISLQAEQRLWAGKNLGSNPLEEIYALWVRNMDSSLDQDVERTLERHLDYRRDTLQSKDQYFSPIPPWLIRPWTLDRDRFIREELEQFTKEHNHPIEGKGNLQKKYLIETRRQNTPLFRNLFPNGAVFFTNLFSALPDAAMIAHWVSHTGSRRRHRVVFATYSVSPFVEGHSNFKIPETEAVFLKEAIQRGIPVAAVDGQLSTGASLTASFAGFNDKISQIAAREGKSPVPFYFILTRGGENAEKRIDGFDGLDRKVAIVQTSPGDSLNNITVFSLQ